MIIKIKKNHPDAVIPIYAKNNDAGMDLVAISKLETELYIEYNTFLSLEIPPGYVGLLVPRSSLSKYHLILANHIGIIDSGYRGNVTARFKKTSTNAHQTVYNVGDKVCQLIVLPYPKVTFEEVSALSETERETGGYGSSGV